jgi:SpoVK/Ycf46/Vps4 family AAA+-type ATPase
MSQYDYIKEIARYALANDNTRLLETLYALVEYAQLTNKNNFALQLQSIIKESRRRETFYVNRLKTLNDEELDGIVFDSILSDYSFEHLVCSATVKKELDYFIKEHRSNDVLNSLNIPLSNKVFFHGPSGCGKTLAAYVLAGELRKPLTIVNLGAIVSSKLGETSKNLTKVFKKAAEERSVIFFDEFDSLGKVRDYDQDHGEMKRVVNTLLQLFDFFSKECIIIAATNQIQLIDEALLRRFDVSIKLDYPQTKQVTELVHSVLKSGSFVFDDVNLSNKIMMKCTNISYYTIKKTLFAAIKRTVLDNTDMTLTKINTKLWDELVETELNATSPN